MHLALNLGITVFTDSLICIRNITRSIGHFTVVCLVTWPRIGSEAGVDLVLIETSLFFICKFKLVSIRIA